MGAAQPPCTGHTSKQKTRAQSAAAGMRNEGFKKASPSPGIKEERKWFAKTHILVQVLTWLFQRRPFNCNHNQHQHQHQHHLRRLSSFGNMTSLCVAVESAFKWLKWPISHNQAVCDNALFFFCCFSRNQRFLCFASTDTHTQTQTQTHTHTHTDTRRHTQTQTHRHTAHTRTLGAV